MNRRIKITAIILLLFCEIFPLNAKLRIAILDIKPGVGQTASQVDGLEDMLNTELFKSGYFTIIERSRVDQVLKANNLYGKSLTNSQYKAMADKLQVDAVLVGTINYIISDVKTASDGSSKITVGEYNVDLRLISVSGEMLSSAAVHAAGKSERETMDMAAREIVRNLDPSVKGNKTVQVLYDYLYVFPEDLGVFSTRPANIIDITNRNNSYGFSDWRLPTEEEVQIMEANATMLRLDNSRTYASDRSSWNKSYNVRLVRTKITVQQRPQNRQRAYFEETTRDFGRIPILGGVVKKRFCLQNPSDRNVSIRNVTKTDSHITVNWDDDAISPGEKAFITVLYNPNGRQGVSFKSTLVVTLSDGQIIDLLVTGKVD
ncbi:MAG: DUF1573 domain-containing protein [Paludibacteraceae bacterium]|nr:DUF1573 domain-containing protein [Paludibacteraceae bacterium]